MKKLSLLIISTISMAGCGGGNAPDSDSLGAGGAGGTVSLLGNVQVCPASSSSKAKVSLPYGKDQSYEVTTNADGSYVLDVDPSKVEGVNPVVLTVESENCAPENIFVENIASSPTVVSAPTVEGSTTVTTSTTIAASTTVVGSTAVAGSASPQGQKNGSTITTTMRDLAPEEFTIPRPWSPLTHLGDEQYGGLANSKLQVATSGLTTLQPVGVLTQKLKDQFKTVYVEFSVRGIQTESLQCATQYDNQIGLSATGKSISSPIVKTVRPGASKANGSFSRFSIPIDLSDIPVGSTINFVANTGQCMSGGVDYDDFELTGVIVRFGK